MAAKKRQAGDDKAADGGSPLPGKRSRSRSGPSGPTQHEAARKAKQRLLRLLPDVDAALERRAKGLGVSVSGYVSGLILADAKAHE